MTRTIERSIMTVGLDSEKKIFSEKMRRKGKKRLLGTGKLHII